MSERAAAAALLLAALAAIGWFARGRPAPPNRRSRYRRWIGRALAAMLVPSVAALALLGRWDAWTRPPPEFAPARALLPAMAAADVAPAAIVGVAIGMAAAAWRARRGGRPIGRPGALTPRTRAELPWGAAVAVVAGVAEEPFFRLLLPLLIALAGGGAILGFALSTLIFAALHRYQGWRGMLATGAFGLVMAGVYLMSGRLWLAALLHALIDLNGLVIWPALSGRLSSSAANPSGRSR